MGFPGEPEGGGGGTKVSFYQIGANIKNMCLNELLQKILLNFLLKIKPRINKQAMITLQEIAVFNSLYGS